jgi:fructosamine-3-kinase
MNSNSKKELLSNSPLLIIPNTKSNFFDYELSSLKELTDKNIPVPQIINKGELDNNSFLLLELKTPFC